MMTNSKQIFLIGCCLLVGLVFGRDAQAGASSSELHVDATLVWGSKAKSDDKKLKPVGKVLQVKLSKSLKWEHYYEISDKSFRLVGSKPHRVRMSDKCEVEVKRTGELEVNVKLIGEGKVVVNRRQSLEKDDSVVLGGPCANQSAWFVVLHFK